jgi:transcription initiation factor IIF auxiliary subunit
MSLKLRNTWNYQGDDWWEWTAYVDDDGTGELKDVEYVQYVLHETFEDPIRRIDTSRGGFKLEQEGWGEFELKAFVHFKDGKKERLRHKLQLEYEPKKGTSA